MRPFDEPVYVTRPVLPPLEDLAERLGAVWESQWLTNNGAQHRELEARLGGYLEAPHLSLFNNGSTALATALRALQLSGEVITTPFTFPATPHALDWTGLTPVFADIDPHSLNIDPDAVESAIGPDTSAILAVHVFGTPCDNDRLQAIAARHGLRLIYDAAHAFGVRSGGRPVGQLGDVSMFSFHATKLFHTAEGGALATRDPVLKQQIDLLRNFGIEGETTVSTPGLNGKMNELQAALGLLVLDMIDRERAQRATLRDHYAGRLAETDGLSLVGDPAIERESFQHLPIRIEAGRFGSSRDGVYDRLRRYNVIARKYFTPLCSDYPHFAALPSSRPGNLPVAHTVASEILCLPFYGSLPLDHADRICDIITSPD